MDLAEFEGLQKDEDQQCIHSSIMRSRVELNYQAYVKKSSSSLPFSILMVSLINESFTLLRKRPKYPTVYSFTWLS